MQAKTLKHPQKRSMQGNAFQIVKHTNKLSNQEMAINVSMAYQRKRKGRLEAISFRNCRKLMRRCPSPLLGKRLFHPVRVALTGSMSGPDIGAQLQLIAAASGQVEALTPIEERVAVLKQWLVSVEK